MLGHNCQAKLAWQSSLNPFRLTLSHRQPTYAVQSGAQLCRSQITLQPSLTAETNVADTPMLYSSSMCVWMSLMLIPQAYMATIFSSKPENGAGTCRSAPGRAGPNGTWGCPARCAHCQCRPSFGKCRCGDCRPLVGAGRRVERPSPHPSMRSGRDSTSKAPRAPRFAINSSSN